MTEFVVKKTLKQLTSQTFFSLLTDQSSYKPENWKAAQKLDNNGKRCTTAHMHI